jgi:sugar lactone lactonase YvrE
MVDIESVSRGVGVVELGEGPWWDSGRSVLWWLDVLGGDVYRYDAAVPCTTHWSTGDVISCVATRVDGSLLVGLRSGFGSFDPATGHVELLVAVEQDVVTNRFNDGNVDPAGRFWAGTMDLDGAAGAGTLYRLEPDLSCTPMLAGVSISNGIDWSPDGSKMYYVDTATQRVDVFDFDLDDGTIDKRRCLVELPRSAGTPDGLTVDAEGHLWVALFGGWAVRRYAPDGRQSGSVDVPVANVTSCAFGGDDLEDLFITTATVGLTDDDRRVQRRAGEVFRARPGVPGRAPTSFGG